MPRQVEKYALVINDCKRHQLKGEITTDYANLNWFKSQWIVQQGSKEF